MTDIRGCGCKGNAIREADRPDKLLARCQELAEQVDELGAEVVEQSDRADKAEAALAVEKQVHVLTAEDANALCEQRDAARADAKALVEALTALVEEARIIRKAVQDEGRPGLMPHIDTYNDARAALAAHKEVTEA